MSPTNWNPEGVANHLTFTWSCLSYKIEAGNTIEVTQNLHVSPHITEISAFSFDIIFQGTDFSLLDINNDGRIDGADILIVARAFGYSEGQPDYNPLADLNNDKVVDGLDLTLVSRYYGESQ